MRHVVMFSGGVGSWATWKRVAVAHGSDSVTALVADTLTEGDDWRPFVDACYAKIGGEMVVLDQGIDVWGLALQQRMIPNTRVDFCSRMLKREPLRAWLEEHRDPADTKIWLGFDWTEQHRLERARPHWEPWTVDAALCHPPYLTKGDLIKQLGEEGLPVPDAYRFGLPHNNCLRTGCVKGGQAFWRNLLKSMPESYKRAEAAEEEVRVHIGKDVAIMRHRSGPNKGKPWTLKDFREANEGQRSLFDSDDWGACSCMESAPA